MGFNKRIIDKKSITNCFNNNVRLTLLFKSDMLILSDKISSKVYKWYMKGFNDELRGTTTMEIDDRLLMKAYEIGSLDSLSNDDMPSSVSWNMVLPDFSGIWKEATKMQQEGEISELQLRKIFRILSGLKNQGEITL
jgi:hypothetical protein